MNINFIDEKPKNFIELKSLASDKTSTSNRLYAINKLGKYRCKESKIILYSLMKSDLVYDVKEQAFRKLQHFGENVKLPKKKKGNLVKNIDKKVEKIIDEIDVPVTYKKMKVIFENKLPIAYDIYTNDKKNNFDKWFENVIKSLPKYCSCKVIMNDEQRNFSEHINQESKKKVNKIVKRQSTKFVGTISDDMYKIKNMLEHGVLYNSLTNITIRKLRNFESDTTINFDYPLTVIVGENGVGKSTLFKLIKSVAQNFGPQDYLINTVLDEPDNCNFMEFEYTLNSRSFKYLKRKHWEFKETTNDFEQKKDYSKLKTNIKDIELKSYLGSYDKNIFFDNVAKKLNRKQKNEYSKRVARKIKQALDNKKDQRRRKGTRILSSYELEIVNFILSRNYEEIIIIEHKYYNGSWGTTILFKDQFKYSEANSGSGEFNVVKLVSEVSRLNSSYILLLDEPEISLHPGAQKRLLRYLARLIIEKKLQIIISTHSPVFVEGLPNNSIKCLRFKGDNTVEIRENISQLEAFKSIEFDFEKINVIVEDSLAKSILEKVAEEEKLLDHFNIHFYPGGASSIKTHLLTAFSKVNDKNKYFILDGDMKFGSVADFSSYPEKELTIDYYFKHFKSVTNIRAEAIQWCTDGSNGKSNLNQKKELIRRYLDYYKKNVYFLPKTIPEDIIFSEEYLEKAFDYINKVSILNIKNNKNKFNKLKELTGLKVNMLYEMFLNYFINTKKETSEYINIKKTLESIIEKYESN